MLTNTVYSGNQCKLRLVNTFSSGALKFHWSQVFGSMQRKECEKGPDFHRCTRIVTQYLSLALSKRVQGRT